MNVIIANKYQTLLGSTNIDVIKTSFGEFEVDEIINVYKNFFCNKLIIDITAVKGYKDIDVIQMLSLNLDVSKVILLLDDSIEANAPEYKSRLVSIGIYNFTRKVETVKHLIDNPNAYKDVANYQKIEEDNQEAPKGVVNIFNEKETQVNKEELSYGKLERRVIGIQNITEHAGSTTLGYLMKKHLEKHYKVTYYEMNKNDFCFFNDEKMEATNTQGIENKLLESKNDEVVIIDLNGDNVQNMDDIIYLIEPGIIKLNKLIKHQPKVFSNLRNQKCILNKSALTSGDVKDFEKECGCKMFGSVPYIDDKEDNNPEINSLLTKLGFTRVSDKAQSGGFKFF